MSIVSAKTGFSRNVAANLLRFAAIILISFFLSPFVVQQLGASGYGVWSLIAGLLGYLSLLDLGIRQAVNRFIAYHHAVNEHSEASAIASTAIKLFSFAGLVAILLATLISFLVPVLFNIPDELIFRTRVVAIIGGFAVAVTLIGNVYGGIVTGVQRFDVQCLLDVGLAIIRAVGTVGVLLANLGLIGLAVVHLVVAIINLIAYRHSARQLYSHVTIDLSIPLDRFSRKILSFAAPSFAIYILVAVSFHSDNVVIGLILPVEFVAYYAIAANLSNQAKGLTDAVSNLMTPRIGALASTGSDGIADEILNVNKLTTLAIAPVAITLLFRGETFIGLWMGSEYAEISGEILSALAIVLWLGATRSVAFHCLTGLAEQKRLIPGLIAESIANIGLSFYLIGSIGLIGVALGTLIPSAVFTLCIIPWVLQNAAGVRVVRLFSHSIVLPTATCFPFGLAIWAIEESWHTDNLLMFFLQLALVLPLVPAVAWVTCLDDAQRQTIKNRVLQ